MPGLLIICQVYPPDPAAVGQHVADVAEEMVRRGWNVRVWTSARGYDDPQERYAAREVRGGVHVRRLPLSSFGKRSIAVRLLAQALFMAQATVLALLSPGASAVLVSTSPPFAGFGGALVALVRRLPLVWWVMDVNPDQMVESGRLGPRSFAVRVFDWMNRCTLRMARDVIVLDRFMRDRIAAKAAVDGKLHVVPPWPHDNVLENVPHDRNPFRRAHGLEGSFVVMYSGNHGYTSPLRTLLDAAARLRHVPGLTFAFVGGGVLKPGIDEMVARESPANVVSLPYQPFAEIRYSLSAADVHVVSIANEGVGVVHPCKIYGALAIGRPIIALAPRASYAADILAGHDVGWLVEHGDVDGLERLLAGLPSLPPERLEAMGRTAREAARTHYSRDAQLGRVCDIIEGTAVQRLPAGSSPAIAGHTA